MKRTFLIIILAAATVWLAWDGTETKRVEAAGDTQASLEQMFTKRENDWAKADNTKDAAFLNRILADDWSYLGPQGVMTKKQHLAELKSPSGGLEFETIVDVKVRVFGDTAVVTGSANQKSSENGKVTSGHYIWTDVFVKRGGRWQAVNSQDTLVTHK
jgi:ketosteroid isomerase-like protein